ncbi:hypothetical protein CRE_07644 [Caenorhabditis remanei]|uniref:Major facilitator superfamily (MFS) profile domain-containing protein n=1 Tax=Caenorhabditis remanei TaxID=31234 RepID=E3MP26_CAERE|nr:hypothetical protein CRE_07644 [Caenorhabditis remanei]
MSSSSEVDESKKWPPMWLSFLSLILAWGSTFNFGFTMLITNPAQEAFVNFVRASNEQNEGYGFGLAVDTQWFVILAILFIGHIIGSLLLPIIARHGRKNSFMFAVLMEVLALLATIASFWLVNHLLFTIARILLGMGTAMAMGLSGITVLESSPTYCRGVASMVNGIFLQFALVVGAVLAMPIVLGNDANLVYLFVFQLCCNLIVLCIVPFLHDSPQFLAHSKEVDHEKTERKVIASIMFYHGITEEQAVPLAKILMETKQGAKAGVFSVFNDPFNRRGVGLGVLTTWGMAMSGITVINAFTLEILMTMGLDQGTAAIANSGTCLFSLAGIITSTFIVDRWDRRSLILRTFSALIVINIAIVILLSFAGYKNIYVSGCLIVAICLFNFVFSMGPGPLSMFIGGEIVTPDSRSAAAVYSNTTMATSRFVTLLTYHSVAKWCSPAAYGIYFIPSMVITVYLLHKHLPESRGRNVADLKAEFEMEKLIE